MFGEINGEIGSWFKKISFENSNKFQKEGIPEFQTLTGFQTLSAFNEFKQKKNYSLIVPGKII